MSAAHTYRPPPRVRPRQSLSARLWLLTTIVVLLSEMAVFLPDVAHERRAWLREHVRDATMALVPWRSHPGLQPPPEMQTTLLRITDAVAIRSIAADGSSITIGDPNAVPDATIDLRDEGLLGGIHHALAAIIWQHDRLVRLVADDVQPPGEIILVFRERMLSRALTQFAGNFAVLALLIAGVTGGLVYLAVLVLLVRPMRRITRSIAAFRADPEHAVPIDPNALTAGAKDEIAVAGQELAAMQHELRAALWRNARLAALGTVFAKISHDLRGILTPALLTGERLQMNKDPKVERAGDTVVQAVERATDLVRRSLDYAREGPPALKLAPEPLSALIDEAVETVRHANGLLRCEPIVDASLLVQADRNQLFRVLVNLMRNAAEAGAQLVRLEAHAEGTTVLLQITDNGPGLPDAVRAELFRPFAGSMRRGGLGLAIARELMVAHGGNIELVASSSDGTCFRLSIPAGRPLPPEPPSDAQRAQIAPVTGADV